MRAKSVIASERHRWIAVVSKAILDAHTITAESLLQQLFHRRRPLNQRVHLRELALRELLPARRWWRILGEAIEQRPDVLERKAQLARNPDDLEPIDDLGRNSRQPPLLRGGPANRPADS